MSRICSEAATLGLAALIGEVELEIVNTGSELKLVNMTLALGGDALVLLDPGDFAYLDRARASLLNKLKRLEDELSELLRTRKEAVGSQISNSSRE